MGSLNVYDPNSGPAVPELPPIPLGALAVGLCDLLGQAKDLVQPRFATIGERQQEITLQFSPDRAGAQAIASWATRFGGVIVAHICKPDGQPHRHITATGDYYGVTVEAYTFIPLTGGENHS